MSYDLFETFDHFIAMYDNDHEGSPNLKFLINHCILYRNIEGADAVNDLINELILIKGFEHDSEIFKILNGHNFGITLDIFKSYIDDMIKSLKG